MNIITLLSAYIQLRTVTDDRAEWFYRTMDWIVTNLVEPLESFGVTWDVFADAKALVVHVPASNGDHRRPVLFLNHADVVPGKDFSGRVEDGFLWGRGALDMKSNLVMQLWALRQFLQSGVRLKRNLVFLINSDEETGGASCQAMVEKHWDELGNPEAVIDEGSFIFEEFLGVCLAPVMVAEKAPGKLVVTADHPVHFTKALQSLVNWQTKYLVHPAVAETLKRAFKAKNQTWLIYVILLMAKVPFFGSWVMSKLFATATSNAMVRNIVNLTQIGDLTEMGNVAGSLSMSFVDLQGETLEHRLDSGGGHASMPDPKDRSVVEFLEQARSYLQQGYLLGTEMRAGFNIRLLPGQDLDQFLAAARKVAGRGVALEIEMWPGTGGQSSWDTEVFRTLERCLQIHGPEGMVVTPSVTTATTDSRYFESRGVQAYRIIPVMIPQALVATIHGTGERVPVKELERGVAIYRELFSRV